jgi:hypothetical protein
MVRHSHNFYEKAEDECSLRIAEYTVDVKGILWKNVGGWIHLAQGWEQWRML